ncbi:MAG: hypothetical protein ACI4L9_02035 [Candidatus Coproplasma sp.]
MSKNKNDISEQENQTDEQENASDEQRSETKTYLWAALAGCVIGAIMFGLTFVPAIGVYGCISAFVCELAALSFVNAQRKRNPLPACKPIEIVCYIIGVAVIALLIGAAIYSSGNA